MRNLSFSDRTANLNITLSEDGGDGFTYDLCKTVGNEGAMSRLYVECQRPQPSRYVRLERLPGIPEVQFINLCEIQVHGYLYYGNTPNLQIY